MKGNLLHCHAARALSALGLTVALLLFSIGAWASPFDLAGKDWEGCADFVEIARSEVGNGRVIVTAQLDLHELRPQDGVVLLHPERGVDAEGLAKFMRAGGRVALLDDFGTGEGLLRHFGMERVAAPARPVETLRNNPELAIAEPASPPHPVAADVTRVVTNHPTGLRHPDLSPVLKIRAVGEPDVVVAVAGKVGDGEGRLLVVSDPSIVINQMLRYGGNKAFARGLFRYVVDDDTSGRHGGRIFIAAGPFEEKGSYGDDSEWGDRLRALREALLALRTEGMPASVAYAFAVAVGLGIVVWVGARAGRVHKAIAPRFTRPLADVAQGGVAGHAAVVGSPRTSRVLAMLELKSALEEQLCAIIGLEELPGHDALLAQIASRGLLDAEGLHALKRVLLRMSSIETMVISERAAALRPIRDREVLLVSKAVRDILKTAQDNANANQLKAARP